MPARILVVDDHGVLRAGLRALLNAEPETEVIGEAASGEDAITRAEALRPDIVLMDLSMSGISGIEVTRRLKTTLPETRVLILTVHEDVSLLREALRAGAAGYIVKRAVESELTTAIRAVLRGELYVHPSMTRALLQPPASETPRSPSRRGDPSALTPRESDVLRLLAKGYTNRQIADELRLSIRTVETHRGNIMGKLGVRNRAEMMRWAAENGLLD